MRPNTPDRRPRAAVHLLLEANAREPTNEPPQLDGTVRERPLERPVEVEDAHVEPRRAKVESTAEVLREHRSRPAHRLQPHRRHASRRPPRDDEVAEPRDTDPRRHLRGRQQERTPVVMLRERVVRVGDGDEVWHRHCVRPRFLDRDRPAARRRVVEGRRDPALPEDHLAGGRPDRPVRRVLLGLDTSVDLAARVGVEVEERARLERRERVRARDHGLRAQRLWMPVVRHLPRDDPAEVTVEREPVDDRQPATALVDEQRAAVRVGAQAERCSAGDEPERRAQLRELRGDDVLRSGLQLPHLPARVDDPERLRGADLHGRLPLGEQHAHLPGGDELHRRAAVVVLQDPLVAPARLGVAARAVLAHPDAVPPAAAVDQEDGAGARPRRQAEEEHECEQDEQPPHRAGQVIAAAYDPQR